MNLFAFALLADENINPDVVAGLRALGCDIVTGELGHSTYGRRHARVGSTDVS